MKPSKVVFFLTTAVTLISIYHLSFTLVDYKIQKESEQKYIQKGQTIDFDKNYAHLAEIWEKPVYRLLGIDYTYAKVKDHALKLGLDLQGGMHVTMELSPEALVKGLVNNHHDPNFLSALQQASQVGQSMQQDSFAKRFVSAYKALKPQEELKDLFTTTDNQFRSYKFKTDQDIIHAIDREITKALDRSLTILRTRLDHFGVSQTNIQCIPGSHRIQIEFPGITNSERVEKLLQGVAQLRFWEVASVDEYRKAITDIEAFLLEREKSQIQSTLAQDISQEEKDSMLPKQSILRRLAIGPFPYVLAYTKEGMDQVNDLLASPDISDILPKQFLFMWSKKMHPIYQGDEKAFILYVVKRSPEQKPLLEGDIIAHASQGFDPVHGRPVVNMQMNSKSAKIWKHITANHIGQSIAIALDDRIYSAPVVNQEIPNGSSQISGNFTIEEAKDLASVLQTGALPAPLKIVEESVIGPTLGKTAQHQGLLASIVGLALVLLFMIVYYKQGGIIVDVALCFNVLFILGTLAQLDAILTLPGIAGLVLTIGMAVDSNVLIFERIREELQSGTHLKEAINRGYHKSYSSIFDSNVTTFLSGAILYYFGQGPVRGFATILMIGILSSVFSSIFITKLILSWLINKYPSIRLRFGTSPRFFKNISIDFISNRRYAYAFSLSILAIGAFCAYKKAIPKGIDFTGGRSYTVHFKHPVDTSYLSDGLSRCFKQNIYVRTYGANNIVSITTNYLNQKIDLETDKKIQEQLVENLNQLIQSKHTDQTDQNSFYISGHSRIGGSVAQDIQQSAKRSLLLSLLGMFLYIAIRFRRWSFGLAAVVALVHDVLAVVASIAIANILGSHYEINEVFIAAILTIVGYSINDTVVIFDRIRQKQQKTDVLCTNSVNKANQETMSRTLITSLTTLITVITVFIFGGEALRGFSLALLFGIVFGTYSSICIATPLLTDFYRSRSK